MAKMHLTDKSYYRFVAFAIIGVIAFFAYMDTLGLDMVNTIGGYTGETYEGMHDSYMTLFWTFAYGIIGVIALLFYYFRRDISEAVAIYVGTVLMLWGGLEDIIYYWMLGMPHLDVSMPWLFDTPLSLMSRVLGESTVTPLGLYLNLAVFTLITICTVKWLRKRNEKIMGLKI
jgi:hypothetical protein